MKKLLIICLLSGISWSLLCQPKNTRDSIQEKIIAYKFFDDFTGLYVVKNDTSIHSFQIYNPVFKNLALNQFLGNLGQANKPSIAFDLIGYSDFLFDTYTRYNYHKPEDNLYYKVRSPYTVLSYYTGGPKSRQEQKLRIIHTQNVNKNWNVGFLGDLVYSDGQYLNQKTAGNYFTLFSSLDGQRYRYNFNVNLNTLKAAHNGGITVDSIYEKSTVRASTIPVNLNSANSIQKNLSVFLQHRFFLTGSYKDDSVKSVSKWNEVVSIIHRLQFERNSRSYTDVLTGTNDFYNNIYIDSSKTHDSIYFRRFENTFLLAINAEPIFKIPAELRVGIKNQLDSWNYKIPGDSMAIERTFNYKNSAINTALTATLTNRFSKTITWGAFADLYFTGHKAGNFHVGGDISKTIRNNFIMLLSGDFKLEKPSYFLQKYASNHFVWDNSSQSPQSTSNLRARFSHEKFKISLEGQAGTYINFVFFNSMALPEIVDKPFNVYMISLKKHFDLKFFQSLFKVTMQRSGNEVAMPLPNIVAYNSSYFAFTLVKNVLKTQIGFDIFYNTRYYAMNYMPSTSIFYSQQNQKVGNYPFIDMFLNISLKRVRFFVKYENLASLTTISKSFYLPHYPYAPGILKYGISWNFYD